MLDVNVNLNDNKINDYINKANIHLKAGAHNKKSSILKQALNE